jgi:hypothetical protein
VLATVSWHGRECDVPHCAKQHERSRRLDDSLIERAVLQARQEADFLYNLVVTANVAIFESRAQREREYILLLGYLNAEMRATPTKDQVEDLRLAVLLFLETVIILDAPIVQMAGESLSGQPVLFRDSSVKLAEQLQMATDLSTWFNELAVEVGVAEINLEELRNSLQSETDRKISIWVILARVEMLSTFGKTDEMHAAMAQGFLLFKSESDESPKRLC